MGTAKKLLNVGWAVRRRLVVVLIWGLGPCTGYALAVVSFQKIRRSQAKVSRNTDY